MVKIPNETREAISTVQLASYAIRVERKPMVIFSAGNLNPGLEHSVQWKSCIESGKHAAK